MMIEIDNLTFRYRAHGPVRPPALKNVSLKIAHGEFLVVAGPSGSGKTTLMQQLTGLLKPDSGRVTVGDSRLHSKGVKLSEIRRRVGLVFQFPETQLFSESVFDDIAFGPRNLGFTESQIKEFVEEACRHLGLDAGLLRTRAQSQLSAGERRLAAIASVVAMQPECLVLDEPTAGLDNQGVRKVIRFLDYFHAQRKTVILITHQLEIVISVASRVVILHAGEVVFDGSPEEVFGDSADLPKVNLPVPRVRMLADFLKSKGLCNDSNVLSAKALTEALSRKRKTVSK